MTFPGRVAGNALHSGIARWGEAYIIFFQCEAMHFRLGPSDDKEPVNSSPPFIDSRRGESMKYINEIGIIEKA